MSGVNNTSANDLSTTESNSNSAVGAPSVKTEYGDSKDSLNLDATEAPIDLPQKPLSAYTTVAIPMFDDCIWRFHLWLGYRYHFWFC
ncbi:CEQ_1a_G0047240.mRNA.1.CDS.1 [Saccharomyces cerevisiae]|nr:CEQ_1a_G0047240.mRNA.1.CDS.1 [Saccharomyces cerevisiae]CAI7433233.1 CEQ_1a_G0047240.mRNA.1.CDS.1 [Saccharomyces cerevisiae]